MDYRPTANPWVGFGSPARALLLRRSTTPPFRLLTSPESSPHVITNNQTNTIRCSTGSVMSSRPIAHSTPIPGGPTHDLADHLLRVGELAAHFAAAFSSGEYARAAGLWHDLGKNHPDFQRKLETNGPERVDHKHAGAIYAIQEFGRGAGLPLAFVIAGHHGGLHDQSCLDTRLTTQEYLDRLAHILADPTAVRPAVAPPTRPTFLSVPGTGDEQKRRYELWVRMLFSCLVDADGLDTEAFWNAATAQVRRTALSEYAAPAELLTRFNRYMSGKADAGGQVNAVRQRILADCRARGRTCPGGVFTLTAPTGAGKTLAGMGFALEHAVALGKERVIVVIPYTSIIDQNAKVYRDVFGKDNVIDHHASLDPLTESQRNKLAAENWDAPVVVTTSVQFCESLFANKPSRCRKLHSIANSVVIFDEVQTLPVGHLLPIVDVLKELVANYKVSLVLSTATQPALKKRKLGLRELKFFDQVTEIVTDVPNAFADLRRVRVVMPTDLNTPTPYSELAQTLQTDNCRRSLTIVHKRADARTLAELVPGSVHLSALMCPFHRLVQLRDIYRLLTEPNAEVRVIATQLVEAGVDLDFPVVYRALAGFDSLAQAAGRCNREGKLNSLGNLGQLHVFVAETPPPPGTPMAGLEIARQMLRTDPKLAVDLLAPERIEVLFDEYFRRLQSLGSLDEAGIQTKREEHEFQQVADNFRMIADAGNPVVVLYGDAASRLADLRAEERPSRSRLRSLQPFVVTLYEPQIKALDTAGAVERIHDLVWALRPTHAHLYDERFGLTLDGPFAADPSALFEG